MADEENDVEDPGTDEAVAEEQPADQQLSQEDEMERFADQAGVCIHRAHQLHLGR